MCAILYDGVDSEGGFHSRYHCANGLFLKVVRQVLVFQETMRFICEDASRCLLFGFELHFDLNGLILWE